jgi:hypothetical protein
LRGHVPAHTVISNELVDAFLQDRGCRLFSDTITLGCSRRVEDAPGFEGWLQAIAVEKPLPSDKP